MQSVNPDVEKTTVIDGLTEAFEAAENLENDMLIYLIDLALAEARSRFTGNRSEAIARS